MARSPANHLDGNAATPFDPRGPDCCESPLESAGRLEDERLCRSVWESRLADRPDARSRRALMENSHVARSLSSGQPVDSLPEPSGNRGG